MYLKNTWLRFEITFSNKSNWKSSRPFVRACFFSSSLRFSPKETLFFFSTWKKWKGRNLQEILEGSEENQRSLDRLVNREKWERKRIRNLMKFLEKCVLLGICNSWHTTLLCLQLELWSRSWFEFWACNYARNQNCKGLILRFLYSNHEK